MGAGAGSPPEFWLPPPEEPPPKPPPPQPASARAATSKARDAEKSPGFLGCWVLVFISGVVFIGSSYLLFMEARIMKKGACPAGDLLSRPGQNRYLPAESRY